MHTVFPVITRKDFSSGNPGDVYICLGMQWLIEEALDTNISWFYLNKFSKKDFEIHKDLLRKAGFCLYAGTPQYNNYDDWCLWYDWPMWMEYLIPFNTRYYTVAGGAGFPDSEMTPEEFTEHCLSSKKTRSILNSRGIRTLGTTVRDKHAHHLLNTVGFENKLLPCTATWASKALNIKRKPSKYIALVPPNPDSVAPRLVGCETKKEAAEKIVNQWLELLDSYKDEEHKPLLVCHGKREYLLFRQHTDKIYYTNDVRALLEFYSECSLVISARLHAVLPAFGMGRIKTVLIQIDTRGSAVEHFTQIPIVSIKDWSLEVVKNAATEAKAASTKQLKTYRTEYIELFKEWFGE